MADDTATQTPATPAAPPAGIFSSPSGIPKTPAPQAPPPDINVDPKASDEVQIMQGLNQGGVPIVAPNGDTGFVHRSYVDQYLKKNPGYERAMIMTDPTGTPGMVKLSEAPKFQKDNPNYTVGLPVHPSPDTAYGSDAWYMSKMPQPVVTGLQAFQKYVNNPLDAMAAWGAAHGGDLAEQTTARGLRGFMPGMTDADLQQARQENPAALGIAKGVGEVAGGMATDPRMWPLMFGGEALPVMQKLAGLGFRGQMLYGAYKTIPAIKEAADRGDVEGVYQQLTKMGVSAYMGARKPQEMVQGTVKPEYLDALRENANRQMERVLGPTTKANKQIAQDVAPELAQRGVTAWTRKGLLSQAQAKTEDLGQQIDQYYQSQNPAERVPTTPILNHLEQSKNAFLGDHGEVNDPEAIARIDALKGVVAQYGPSVSLNDIVRLRRMWDQQVSDANGFYGKTVAEGSALEAKRAAAGAIREELAKQYPDLDQVNKEYSFWANVQRVVGDTVERKGSQATPLGEQVLASGGLAHAGPKGAAAWWALRKAMTSTAWETASAKIKYQIADLLADGNVEQAAKVAQQLPLQFKGSQTIPAQASTQGPLFEQPQPTPPITAPSRMLGPARLPQTIMNPTPGFEAPTAPSASAEQAAIQQAASQGRGPVGTIRQLGMVPGPSGYPEARVTQTPTPAPETPQAGAGTPAEGTPKPGPLGPLFSRPLSGPPAPTAQLDLPGMNLPARAEPFYSKAEQIASAKLPKSGPGDSFLSTLRNNGVKAEEISDLGLDSFAGKQKVTKEEFLDAIRSRRPQLSQTTLGEPEYEPRHETMYEEYATPGGENYREVLTQYPPSEAARQAQSLKDEIATRQRELDDEIDRYNSRSNPEDINPDDDPFAFQREGIAQLQRQVNALESQTRQTDYRSGHWQDYPNVMAHSRESDFTTTDNMDVRHVHEVQSDLHQKGREQGYLNPPIRQLPEGYHTQRNPNGYYQIVNREGVPVVRRSLPSQEAAINDFIDSYNQQNANTSGAPNAPFKKSWHELAVKDSIRRAIEDGKQGMTWDTGETQANRYDLAKQVERVEYDPHTETLNAYDHSGRQVVDENVKPEDLHQYVGKEGAEHLQRQIENYSGPPYEESDFEIRYDPEAETYSIHDPNGEMIGEEETHRDAERMISDYVDDERQHHELPSLHGEDLQVGGHGMKGFYDKIIPDFVRKYTKKWGAKVDTAEIPTSEDGQPYKVDDANGELYDGFRTREMAEDAARDIGGRVREPDTTTVHRLTFTPDMINAIKSEGQPLYSKELAQGEPDLEAARRGAEGTPPAPDRAQQANARVDQLRAQLERQRAAGDVGGASQTVAQLRNAEDELGQQPLASRPLSPEEHDQMSPSQRSRLIWESARDMRPQLDEGGPDRAARIHVDDHAYNLLNALLPKQRGWLGINFHGEDGLRLADALRKSANRLDEAGYSDTTQGARNMRILAGQFERAAQLNFDPNAGHAGVPVIRDPSAAQHEAEIHTGQRALDPHGDIANFTDTDRVAAHPAVQKAMPVLQRIGATRSSAEIVAEMEAHILDGSYKDLGLTPEEAVDFIKHSRDVLGQFHGQNVMENLPRLAQRYVQALDKYTGGQLGRAGEAAAQTAHEGRAGEVEAENAGAGENAQGAVGRGDREAGPSEGQVAPQQRPLFSRRLDKEAEARRISTRNPTAPSATENPLTDNLRIDTQAIRDTGKADDVADLFRKYPGLRSMTKGLDTEGVLSGYQRHAEGNILYMHDQYPEEFRKESKKWYDGAHDVAGRQFTRDYGTSIEQAAGGIAAISPKLEWNKNVAIEKRVVEAMLQQNDLRYTPQMNATAREWLNDKAAKDPEGVPVLRKALREINGRKLGDLETPDQKALWIHLYQEAHGDPSYDIYAPDGSIVGKARTKAGQLANLGWAMDGNVAKAVSIFENPSRENISNELGTAHKTRNFYNNQVAPNSPSRDVTVDTHAVAAGLMRPLAMDNPEVKQNFGSAGGGSSKLTGVMGTYGVNADAYRGAADKRNVLPRQMQSMSWDNTRTLFPKEFKTETNQGIIDKLWRDYDNGDKTIGQTRRAIVDAAGGWRPPDWAGYQPPARSRSYSGKNEAARPASQSQNVPDVGVPRSDQPGAVGGGRSGSAGAVPAARRGVSSSPIPPALKRVMRK